MVDFASPSSPMVLLSKLRLWLPLQMSLSSVVLICTQHPSVKEDAISRITREGTVSDVNLNSIHCTIWRGFPSLNSFFSIFCESPAFFQEDDRQEAAFALLCDLKGDLQACSSNKSLANADWSFGWHNYQKTLSQYKGDWIVLMVRLKSRNCAFCSFVVFPLFVVAELDFVWYNIKPISGKKFQAIYFFKSDTFNFFFGHFH